MSVRWAPAEDATLREIISRRIPPSFMRHRLPGRTLAEIRTRIHEMRFGMHGGRTL